MYFLRVTRNYILLIDDAAPIRPTEKIIIRWMHPKRQFDKNSLAADRSRLRTAENQKSTFHYLLRELRRAAIFH